MPTYREIFEDGTYIDSWVTDYNPETQETVENGGREWHMRYQGRRYRVMTNADGSFVERGEEQADTPVEHLSAAVQGALDLSMREGALAKDLRIAMWDLLWAVRRNRPDLDAVYPETMPHCA